MSTALDFQPEVKSMWGQFSPRQEFKTITLPSGVEVGLAKGLLATWDIDEGNDHFIKGAFLDSIAEHRARGMRQIRLSDEHSWEGLIGGFPIENVKETDAGLEVEANINLMHSKGRDVWALIMQRVIVDFSIGYSVQDFEDKDNIRKIFKATIWHGSTVSEPMNRAAQIQAIKSLQAKLPIAPEDTEWVREEAWKRVRLVSSNPALTCIGHKSVCDVVNGVITIIPQALTELVESGVHAPDEIRMVERYYAAMKKASPFDRAERQFFTREDAEAISAKELELLLVSTDRLSKKTAKYLVSRFEGLDSGDGVHQDPKSNGIAELIKSMRATRGA